MAVENVLISFTAETAGLQPGIDGLVQLEVVDKNLAEQVKKTSAEINKRDASISASAKASSKSVEGLSTAFSNLGKVNLGAAFSKTFAEIKSTLNLTDRQLRIFYENIKKNSKAEILKGGTKEELQTLNQLIKGADKALAELGNTTQAAEKKSQSFRVQLRQIRDELQAMEDAGMEGSAAFEELQLKAGKLADQMGDTQARIQALSSDTFIFDAIASGVQGVVGAFTAAQGAAALFGNENEDLQKALLKVQGAMALLQGVQQVVNVLQKQSAASIAIDLVLRRNQAAATTAQAVAQTELTAATTAGTVATGALNAVMAVNPAVLLVTAIAALAGAVYYFANAEDEARENTEAFNDALLDQLDINKKLEDSFKDQIAEGTRGLENELAYAEKAGKSQIELGKIRQRVASQRALIAQIGAEANEKELNSIESYRTAYENALREISQVKEQIKITPDNKEELEEQIKGLQQTVDINKEKYDSAKAIATEYHDSVRDLNLQTLENEKLSYEQSVKSAVAAVEARLAAVKRGTKEERDLQIEAIRARVKAETDRRINPDLTPGERAKIEREAQRQIQDIHFEFQKKALIDAKAGIDAQVEMAKAGSKEEFDLRMQSLEAGRQIELKDQLITDNKKREINAKFYKDAAALSRAFYKKVSEDALNTDIAETNARITQLQVEGAKETNDQLYALKKKLIDDQAELEIVAIRASEDNEELNRAKIKAVYARQLADKKQLERDKAYAEITSSRQGTIDLLQQRIDANDEEIASDRRTTEEKRRLRLDSGKALLEMGRKEETMATALYAQGAISYEEYEARKTAAKKKQSSARVAMSQAEQEKIVQILGASQQVIDGIFDVASNLKQKQFEKELANAQELYDKKLITEKEYNNRVRQVRRQQAQQEKMKGVFDIWISTAKNIVEAFPNPVLIALAAALGATQAAAVISQPLPQFKHGKVGIEGPGTETSDSILARLSKKESVINAAMTRKHTPALEAINSNKFQEYLIKYELPKMWDQFQMPVIPPATERQVEIRNAPAQIDYEKLGNVVAQKLGKALESQPVLNFSMDQDGFNMSVKKGLAEIEYKNKKLLM